MRQQTMLLFALPSVVAVSCYGHDDIRDSPRLGIELRDSSLVIRCLACVDEEVETVHLYELNGDQIAGGEGDALLWQADESDLAALVGAGVVPSDAGRAVTLKNGARYFLDLETSEEEFGDLAGLSLNDFDIGKVRVLGKNFSEAEFVTGASSSC